jgi:hypothetical protein
LQLKRFIIIFFILLCYSGFGQVDSSNTNKLTKLDTNTLPAKPKDIIAKKILPKTDSLKKLPVIVLLDSSKIKDSLRLKDSLKKVVSITDSLHKDSIRKVNIKAALPKIDTSTYAKILVTPYLPFNGQAEFMIQKEHHAKSKDELFYILLGCCTLLGLIKLVFPKYFSNMFGLFFQTTLRSKQTREQLLQNTFASLLMNILFITCGGIYIALIVQLKGWVSVDFWWLILYSAIILGIIYSIKFAFLHFAGWVFNTKEAASTYIFIVFLSNKIITIVLLPFLLVLAFTGGLFAEIALTISLFVVMVMLLYRYLVSLSSVRSDLSINPLHFFLYLCSIEILPLLIIYKAAFNYIGTSI